jgi:hypothetical protein
MTTRKDRPNYHSYSIFLRLQPGYLLILQVIQPTLVESLKLNLCF